MDDDRKLPNELSFLSFLPLKKGCDVANIPCWRKTTFDCFCLLLFGGSLFDEVLIYILNHFNDF